MADNLNQEDASQISKMKTNLKAAQTRLRNQMKERMDTIETLQSKQKEGLQEQIKQLQQLIMEEREGSQQKHKQLQQLIEEQKKEIDQLRRQKGEQATQSPQTQNSFLQHQHQIKDLQQLIKEQKLEIEQLRRQQGSQNSFLAASNASLTRLEGDVRQKLTPASLSMLQEIEVLKRRLAELASRPQNPITGEFLARVARLELEINQKLVQPSPGQSQLKLERKVTTLAEDMVVLRAKTTILDTKRIAQDQEIQQVRQQGGYLAREVSTHGQQLATHSQKLIEMEGKIEQRGEQRSLNRKTSFKVAKPRWM